MGDDMIAVWLACGTIITACVTLAIFVGYFEFKKICCPTFKITNLCSCPKRTKELDPLV